MTLRASERLFRQAFPSLLSNIFAAAMREAGTEPVRGKTLRFRWIKPLPFADGYARRALGAVFAITEVLEQMEMSRKLMAGYRAKGMSPITRSEYLLYHIENHAIRTSSLLDRALKLANVLFDLGLPPKECNQGTVLQNSHVRETEVCVAVQCIGKTVGPLTKRKNDVVHSRGLVEDDLQVVDLLQISGGASRQLATQLRNRFVAERKEEMGVLNATLVDQVEALFEASLPVFRDQYKRWGGKHVA